MAQPPDESLSSGAANEVDSRLRGMVEMRLRHRLEDFSHDLEERATEGVTAAPAASMGSGFLARDARTARVTTLIEQHAERLLADLAAFLAEASDDAARPWLLTQLDSHLDRTVARALAALGCGGDPVAAGTAALRNRFANLAAGIRARGRATLASVSISTVQVDAGAAQAAQELDDRLPLRRRRVFDRDLQELVGQCAASGQPLGLVMIDLDLFKRVNDEHGHPTGDEVLLAVSNRVVQRVGRKGRAYRYGGEELALLLPGYSWEEALGLAERIRKDVAGAPMTGKSIVVTASLGVASLPDDATDGLALLQRADRALYLAKHAGRNCARAAASLGEGDSGA